MRYLLATCVCLCVVLAAGASDGADQAPGYIDVQIHLLISRQGKTPGVFSRGRRNAAPGTAKMDADSQAMAAAERLLTLMDKYGVAQAMLLPPPRMTQNQYAGELDVLARVVQAYPERFALVGGGNILNEMIHIYSPEQVSQMVQRAFTGHVKDLVAKGVKAFGEIAALHLSFNDAHVFEETLPDHPLFMLLMDLAAEHGIPIDLHMEAVVQTRDLPAGFSRVSSRNAKTLQGNIAAFERMLAHNRKARVVWLHNGWDNTGDRSVELLKRLLTAHGNLYLALRNEARTRTMAGTPMPNRMVDGQGKIKADWLALFQAFPDRFVIGSDEFQPPWDMRVPQSFAETWSLLKQLPEDLARKIGRDNAARIYGL